MTVRPWRTLAVVALALLAGAALGAVGLRAWQAATTDAEAARQKAKLEALAAELSTREAELARGQQELQAQAAGLRAGAERASALAAQIGSAQGSAVERLKRVGADLRELSQTLRALSVGTTSAGAASGSGPRP